MKTALWLGSPTTTWGTILQGHSVREVEDHCLWKNEHNRSHCSTVPEYQALRQALAVQNLTKPDFHQLLRGSTGDRSTVPVETIRGLNIKADCEKTNKNAVASWGVNSLPFHLPCAGECTVWVLFSQLKAKWVATIGCIKSFISHVILSLIQTNYC